MSKPINILDCTLRDGGYYTNWDFDKELVYDYCKAINNLPIDYVEVGYRSIPLKGYLGQYFYCPIHVLESLKTLMPAKKLVIILNEKDIRQDDVKELLEPCQPFITLIRIAVDPKNFKRAIKLAKEVKLLGFEVAFNVMYMSNWKEDASFLDLLSNLDNTIDFFYMVDSFGGVLPKDVKEITRLVKSKTNITLGFHGHNNLEMALINTITAIEEGCQIVDCTITGMGRGAGNLKTELLLTYLDKYTELNFNYTPLSNITASFEKLKKDYDWGTNLPYMFSGAFSLPQKQVMEWVGMNRYPMSSLVNALKNQKEALNDNEKLPEFECEKKYKEAIILGGGQTAQSHSQAIKRLLEKRNDGCLIHAGVRNVSTYLDVENDQYYALVGFESEKLLKNIGDVSKISQTCVYPPFPRQMGTVIPNEIREISKELKRINFLDVTNESPLAIALQTAFDLGVEKIFFAGFDGYENNVNLTQQILTKENQTIFDKVLFNGNLELFFLTPTKYNNITKKSIYSLI